MGFGEIIKTQPVPMVLNLWEGAEVKFPQAIVRDSAGGLLYGGPVDLVHQGEGRYANFSKTALEVGVISVLFITYNDAAHLLESKQNGHSRTMDVYRIVDPNVITNTTIGKFRAVLRGTPLTGILNQQPELIGKLGPPQLFATVTKAQLKGILRTEQHLTGKIGCD